MNTKNIGMCVKKREIDWVEGNEHIEYVDSRKIDPIKKSNKTKLLEELFQRYKSKMKHSDSKSYSEFKRRIAEDESASLATCESKKKSNWFKKIFGV